MCWQSWARPGGPKYEKEAWIFISYSNFLFGLSPPQNRTLKYAPPQKKIPHPRQPSKHIYENLKKRKGVNLPFTIFTPFWLKWAKIWLDTAITGCLELFWEMVDPVSLLAIFQFGQFGPEMKQNMAWCDYWKHLSNVLFWKYIFSNGECCPGGYNLARTWGSRLL